MESVGRLVEECEGDMLADQAREAGTDREAVLAARERFGGMNLLLAFIYVAAPSGREMEFWPKILSEMTCGSKRKVVYISLAAWRKPRADQNWYLERRRWNSEVGAGQRREVEIH